MYFLRVLTILGLLASGSIAIPVETEPSAVNSSIANITNNAAERFPIGCYHISGYIQDSPTCLNYQANFIVTVCIQESSEAMRNRVN